MRQPLARFAPILSELSCAACLRLQACCPAVEKAFPLDHMMLSMPNGPKYVEAVIERIAILRQWLEFLVGVVTRNPLSDHTQVELFSLRNPRVPQPIAEAVYGIMQNRSPLSNEVSATTSSGNGAPNEAESSGLLPASASLGNAASGRSESSGPFSDSASSGDAALDGANTSGSWPKALGPRSQVLDRQPAPALSGTPVWPTPSGAAWSEIQMLASRAAVTLSWILADVYGSKSPLISHNAADKETITSSLKFLIHHAILGHLLDPRLDVADVYFSLLVPVMSYMKDHACSDAVCNELCFAMMQRYNVDTSLARTQKKFEQLQVLLLLCGEHLLLRLSLCLMHCCKSSKTSFLSKLALAQETIL